MAERHTLDAIEAAFIEARPADQRLGSGSAGPRLLRRVSDWTTAELIEAGAVTPVIDRVYPLEQVAGAASHVAGRHARGTVAVSPPDGEPRASTRGGREDGARYPAHESRPAGHPAAGDALS